MSAAPQLPKVLQLPHVAVTRRCRSCGADKPEDLDHYHRDLSTVSGFTARCADCRDARDRYRYREYRTHGRPVQTATLRLTAGWCPHCEQTTPENHCDRCGATVHGARASGSVVDTAEALLPHSVELDITTTLSRRPKRYRVVVVLGASLAAKGRGGVHLDEIDTAEYLFADERWISISEDNEPIRRGLHILAVRLYWHLWRARTRG